MCQHTPPPSGLWVWHRPLPPGSCGHMSGKRPQPPRSVARFPLSRGRGPLRLSIPAPKKWEDADSILHPRGKRATPHPQSGGVGWGVLGSLSDVVLCLIVFSPCCWGASLVAAMADAWWASLTAEQKSLFFGQARDIRVSHIFHIVSHIHMSHIFHTGNVGVVRVAPGCCSSTGGCGGGLRGTWQGRGFSGHICEVVPNFI